MAHASSTKGPVMVVFAIIFLLSPVPSRAARYEILDDADIYANGTLSFTPGDATNSNKCRKGDESGCLQCDATIAPSKRKVDFSTYGYTLTRDAGSWTKYTLSAQDGGTAHLNLPILNSLQAAGEGSERNCFAMATHQAYLTPGEHGAIVKIHGNSPVHMPSDVTDANLKRALELEEAIFLGRTDEELKHMTLKGKVEDGRVYYVVAVLLEPGSEYHFWGLWNNGWYCVASQISPLLVDLGHQSHVSDLCPRAAVFTQLVKKGTKYNGKMGGFYLFPCRGEGSQGLSGPNKC